MENVNNLPYTRISKELNDKVSEIITEYNNLLDKAKSYGLDIKFASDCKNSLSLYFHDDYPDTILVDKCFSCTLE